MLTSYVSEVPGDHQCGFRRNRSTVDQIFYIRQILQKKREYNGTVYQLFIDFKKAYDSIKREVLCNILLEFGIPKKLVRLIKMCLNETYSKFCLINFLFRMAFVSLRLCICVSVEKNLTNRVGEIVGFGETQEDNTTFPCALQTAYIQIFTSAECNESQLPSHIPNPRVLCAGVIGGGVDSCQVRLEQLLKWPTTTHTGQ
jgi:hypothetical protein